MTSIINENKIMVCKDKHGDQDYYYVVKKGPTGVQYLTGLFHTKEAAEEAAKRFQ